MFARSAVLYGFRVMTLDHCAPQSAHLALKWYAVPPPSPRLTSHRLISHPRLIHSVQETAVAGPFLDPRPCGQAGSGLA
ncbi:hypothetical protein CKO25_14250 [Thiocapsa imhoffii]|uniref:Uncharacterized protein n=1 Tax=Thiocapsa imhoffii TaxID=382777 RepID=A0A9X0WJP2_9GAMM|nr:hypothetical protein [Thiocapsa imhoffii]